jgi:hypothetical protein
LKEHQRDELWRWPKALTNGEPNSDLDGQCPKGRKELPTKLHVSFL